MTPFGAACRCDLQVRRNSYVRKVALVRSAGFLDPVVYDPTTRSGIEAHSPTIPSEERSDEEGWTPGRAAGGREGFHEKLPKCTHFRSCRS